MQLVDIAATQALLQRDLATEANPAAAWLFKTSLALTWIVKMFFTLPMTVFLGMYFRRGLFALIIVYLIVNIRHLVILLKAIALDIE